MFKSKLIELGGNIVLEGFDELDPSTLVVVKKIIGNYAKKISSTTAEFGNLSLILKNYSDTKVDLQAKINIKGSINIADASDQNLFFAIDKALTRLSKEIQ